MYAVGKLIYMCGRQPENQHTQNQVRVVSFGYMFFERIDSQVKKYLKQHLGNDVQKITVKLFE